MSHSTLALPFLEEWFAQGEIENRKQNSKKHIQKNSNFIPDFNEYFLSNFCWRKDSFVYFIEKKNTFFHRFQCEDWIKFIKKYFEFFFYGITKSFCFVIPLRRCPNRIENSLVPIAIFTKGLVWLYDITEHMYILVHYLHNNIIKTHVRRMGR